MSEQAGCNLYSGLEGPLRGGDIGAETWKRRSQECKERGRYPNWREQPEQRPWGRKQLAFSGMEKSVRLENRAERRVWDAGPTASCHTIKPNSLPRPQVPLAHCYLSDLISFCSPSPSLHLRHHVLFIFSPDTSGICLPQGLGTSCSFHPTAWYLLRYLHYLSISTEGTNYKENVVTSQWRSLTDTTLTKASVTFW